MRRREFIALTGAAVAFPHVALAQQAQTGTKRLAFVFTIAETDPSIPRYRASLLEGLRGQGWEEGKNLVIDYRWAISTNPTAQTIAADVLARRPDILLLTGTAAPVEFARVDHTIPKVFTLTTDPIGLGLVTSLGHPGGIMTGFTNLQETVGGKWMELLKEIKPSVRTVGILMNPEAGTSFDVYLPIYQDAARRVGVSIDVMRVRGAQEIPPAIAARAAMSDAGMIVHIDAFLIANRALIVSETARAKLAAISPHVLFADAGAAVTYCLDPYDAVRGAAEYVGRILNGANPGDLPVQAPSKYSLIVNLKTLRVVGLNLSPEMLIRADQVIE